MRISDWSSDVCSSELPAGGRLGGRPCTDLTLRLLDHPKVCSKGVTMSRFKNEITHLQAHIKTLRLGAGALVIVALVMGGGWWSAPRDLTIHVPPDLRSGSTRKWWEEIGRAHV